MAIDKIIRDKDYWKKLDELIEKGLQKTSTQLIEEEKKNNGYLVIGDKDGKIIKVPAKDL